MLKSNFKIAIVTIITLLSVLAVLAHAQNPNPYEGYKIPPLEIPSTTKYTHKFIDIFGSQMAYVDEGSGDPILFVHGTPMSSYLWRNIMPHLEKQGRVIAPDLIGMGKSDQPDLKYTFDDQYKYFESFI